jgi:hypothetical protein
MSEVWLLVRALHLLAMAFFVSGQPARRRGGAGRAPGRGGRSDASGRAPLRLGTLVAIAARQTRRARYTGGRLSLLDLLSGDSTLSVRGDEAEEAWRIVTPRCRRGTVASPWTSTPPARKVRAARRRQRGLKNRRSREGLRKAD